MKNDRPVHVIVVEDDFDTAFLLMNRLNNDKRLEAVHISTARAAMDRSLWSNHSQKGLVGVFDLMLPDVSGVEIARWVRKSSPSDIPLIALTALITPQDTQTNLKNHGLEIVRDAAEVFDLVLAKPFSGSRLIDLVVDLARGKKVEELKDVR